ncbi:NAD(P)-binding protein [Coprinellus micaceus]|uniref:NAD(P)-binding protein n=1 Tax=Coprinellus micaceus TaxID=71717 RepID=A0A4Y7T085_COPMI|nr:NAD(P)-binding protein [Coprinellus micaceus]
MTTLITGGGSQTGLRLAQILKAHGKPFLIGSRSGKRIPADYPTFKFDWHDFSTFQAPFAAGDKIDSVFVVGPDDYDPLPFVKPFIDLAVEKGLKRFVVLSACSDHNERGPNAKEMGRVHTYVHEKGLDYVALRLGWFTENLLTIYGDGIKEKNVIEGVVPNGRISFVAVDDIAEVAFKAITDPDSLPSREPNVLGPDFVSYKDVAAILTEVLGRVITYQTITAEELKRRYTKIYGIDEEYASAVVKIEQGIENGSEEKWLSDPRTVKGKVGVREWVEKNKNAFEAAGSAV